MRMAQCWMGALAVALAGCAHPCGYVDVSARLTPQGDGVSERGPASLPLQVVQVVSPDNAVIAARLTQRETTVGFAVQERRGRRVYVPYRWYAFVAKPLVSVTLVPPFILAAWEPHAHSGRPWSQRDYFRDVIAWFNPFSGIPMARQEIAAEPTVLDTAVRRTITAERDLPLEGRVVRLFVDGAPRGEAVTDGDGIVRFDLSAILTDDDAGVSRSLTLKSEDGFGGEAETTRPLAAETIRAVLKLKKTQPS